MARFNYKEIKSDYDKLRKEGREQLVFDALESNIEDGSIKPREFNIKECFLETVEGGSEMLRSWSRGHEVNLMEAGNPTDAFGRITERVIRGEVMEGSQDPAFLGDQLITTRPTDAYDGERLPGMTRLGNASEEVGIGQPFPETTFTEDYIDLPATVKKGNIVSLAKEHIMADRTALLLDRAREVGYWLGYDKELRIMNCVTGSDGATYKRRERTAASVYGDNSGSHDWDNLAASNALYDWTDIEAAELLFDAMTDPNTGEPILLMPNVILVPTALKHTARRIVSATQIEHVSGLFDNDAATGNEDNRLRTQSANTLDAYTILSSQLVKKVTTSASTWYIGDPKRAFQYRENWPVTVAQQGAGSESEFTKDIVMRFKASERGVCVPIEPRFMVKCTA